MNPAWSVIFFTTLAGLGQGLVVAFAVPVLLGATPVPGLVRTALVLALVLLVGGLAASFLHLGRPARAWRAAAMWRTSWLSREVIVLPLFIATVLAAAALAPRVPAALWLALVLLAALLWWCTAMIYACLRFIAEWAHPYTIASFALTGLASGAVLAGALAGVAGDRELGRALAPWALAMTLAAALVRIASLLRNQQLKPTSTAQSATGIRAAEVRQIAMGMTGPSFAVREFFHRAPAALLPHIRSAFLLLLFGLPAALLAWVVTTRSPLAWPWLAALAAMLPGLLAERWFFFAQARHPQNIYYQRVG